MSNDTYPLNDIYRMLDGEATSAFCTLDAEIASSVLNDYARTYLSELLLIEKSFTNNDTCMFVVDRFKEAHGITEDKYVELVRMPPQECLKELWSLWLDVMLRHNAPDHVVDVLILYLITSARSHAFVKEKRGFKLLNNLLKRKGAGDVAKAMSYYISHYIGSPILINSVYTERYKKITSFFKQEIDDKFHASCFMQFMRTFDKFTSKNIRAALEQQVIDDSCYRVLMFARAIPLITGDKALRNILYNSQTVDLEEPIANLGWLMTYAHDAIMEIYKRQIENPYAPNYIAPFSVWGNFATSHEIRELFHKLAQSEIWEQKDDPSYTDALIGLYYIRLMLSVPNLLVGKSDNVLAATTLLKKLGLTDRTDRNDVTHLQDVLKTVQANNDISNLAECEKDVLFGHVYGLWALGILSHMLSYGNTKSNSLQYYYTYAVSNILKTAWHTKNTVGCTDSNEKVGRFPEIIPIHDLSISSLKHILQRMGRASLSVDSQKLQSTLAECYVLYSDAKERTTSVNSNKYNLDNFDSAEEEIEAISKLQTLNFCEQERALNPQFDTKCVKRPKHDTCLCRECNEVLWAVLLSIANQFNKVITITEFNSTTNPLDEIGIIPTELLGDVLQVLDVRDRYSVDTLQKASMDTPLSAYKIVEYNTQRLKKLQQQLLNIMDGAEDKQHITQPEYTQKPSQTQSDDSANHSSELRQTPVNLDKLIQEKISWAISDDVFTEPAFSGRFYDAKRMPANYQGRQLLHQRGLHFRQMRFLSSYNFKTWPNQDEDVTRRLLSVIAWGIKHDLINPAGSAEDLIASLSSVVRGVMYDKKSDDDLFTQIYHSNKDMAILAMLIQSLLIQYGITDIDTLAEALHDIKQHTPSQQSILQSCRDKIKTKIKRAAKKNGQELQNATPEQVDFVIGGLSNKYITKMCKTETKRAWQEFWEYANTKHPWYQHLVFSSHPLFTYTTKAQQQKIEQHKHGYFLEDVSTAALLSLFTVFPHTRFQAAVHTDSADIEPYTEIPLDEDDIKTISRLLRSKNILSDDEAKRFEGVLHKLLTVNKSVFGDSSVSSKQRKSKTQGTFSSDSNTLSVLSLLNDKKLWDSEKHRKHVLSHLATLYDSSDKYEIVTPEELKHTQKRESDKMLIVIPAELKREIYEYLLFG